jgi:hypothetical protein
MSIYLNILNLLNSSCQAVLGVGRLLELGDRAWKGGATDAVADDDRRAMECQLLVELDLLQQRISTLWAGLSDTDRRLYRAHWLTKVWTKAKFNFSNYFFDKIKKALLNIQIVTSLYIKQISPNFLGKIQIRVIYKCCIFKCIILITFILMGKMKLLFILLIFKMAPEPCENGREWLPFSGSRRVKRRHYFLDRLPHP